MCFARDSFANRLMSLNWYSTCFTQKQSLELYGGAALVQSQLLAIHMLSAFVYLMSCIMVA